MTVLGFLLFFRFLFRCSFFYRFFTSKFFDSNEFKFRIEVRRSFLCVLDFGVSLG